MANANGFSKDLSAGAFQLFRRQELAAQSTHESLTRAASRPLISLTSQIVDTFKLCNPDFHLTEKLPQRVLTQPSEGVLNNGLDNKDGNMICRVHDVLTHGESKYTVLDLLGTGTFGQVFRCIKVGTSESVAVKVIKNKPAYHAQGLLEIKIAKLLNQSFDPQDQAHIVRLKETFEVSGHICLVFELLSMSLLDVLTQNQFRGLPLHVVQRFTAQILKALVVLQDANIIHCDLKPENILLAPPREKRRSSTGRADDGGGGEGASSSVAPPADSNKIGEGSEVKVIDFGSACFEGKTMYTYIQSRFCKY